MAKTKNDMFDTIVLVLLWIIGILTFLTSVWIILGTIADSIG